MSGDEQPSIDPANRVALRRTTAVVTLALRFGRAVGGLLLTGIGLGLLMRSELGAPPWDVLHLALARLLHVSPGVAIIGTSVVVMVLWLPLRVRPGLCTAAGVVVPGLAVDATLAVLGPAHDLAPRLALLVSGTVVFVAGTITQLSAALGPAARDGLMIGLAARGWCRVGVARTAMELAALAGGVLLIGLSTALHVGIVGPGTVVFALTVGPLIGLLLHLDTAAKTPSTKEVDACNGDSSRPAP